MPSLYPENRPPSNPEPSDWEDVFSLADIVSTYTRVQAIENGTLVDVTEATREVGYTLPVAVTAALWADLEAIPPGHAGQEVSGRLREVLTAGYEAMQRHAGAAETLVFPVTLPVLGEQTSDYPVKLVFHADEDGLPVITMRKLDED